ncbi:MAG: Snf7 family protein [Candidatus Hodarchaeota archaeon]
MGKIQEFLGWLSSDDDGGGKKTSYRRPGKGKMTPAQRTRKMLFKLKRQIMKMDKMQKKLEFQADNQRKKAIEAKRNGDDQRAKMYAKEMLKYRKLSANMINFVSGLEGMKFKLEQVVETQRMSEMFQSIDISLQNMKESINVPEIQETLDSINSTITDMDVNLEFTTEGIEMATDANVSDVELSKAMEEIDAGLAVEGLELPTAAAETEDLKEWKDKIDALKD